MVYKAVITGHEPPFKWTIKRRTQDGQIWLQVQLAGLAMVKGGPFGGTSVEEDRMIDCKGEAPSFNEAMEDATHAACEAEWARQHAATVYEEVILETEPQVDIPGTV